MKKISYLFISIFLLFCSNLLLADVVVSNITSPAAMNGTYTELGTYNSRPYYERSSGGDTYSLFYLGDMVQQWIIFDGDGPFEHGMWAFNGCYFYASSNSSLPIGIGYDDDDCAGMSVGELLGAPIVSSVTPIPVSLWVIVAVFIIAGGLLVFRYYRKQEKVA